MFQDVFKAERLRISKPQILQEKALILGIFLGVMITMIVATMSMVLQSRYYTAQLDRLRTLHMQEIEEVHLQYANTIEEKDNEIIKLTAEKTKLEDALEQVSSDNEAEFALLKKYWYVLEEAPVDGGLTSDLIVYADTKCKENDINPHLVWGMIDHESNYTVVIDNSRSSARGLGQFLESTARIFYEQERFLGNGTGSYDHTLAYDPYINIDLIVEYLVYLRDSYDGDTRIMLRYYSGSSSDDYYNAVRKDMAKVGEDISAVNYK